MDGAGGDNEDCQPQMDILVRWARLSQHRLPERKCRLRRGRAANSADRDLPGSEVIMRKSGMAFSVILEA